MIICHELHIYFIWGKVYDSITLLVFYYSQCLAYIRNVSAFIDGDGTNISPAVNPAKFKVCDNYLEKGAFGIRISF